MHPIHRLVEEHYSSYKVEREIADFCRGRWVAVHCTDEKGGLVFRRYIAERPIVVEKGEDLQALFGRLGHRPRSI
ncbi:MAG: hypothetical protein QXH67_01575, partial [Candidatus Bathyarchaeia archaeon]